MNKFIFLNRAMKLTRMSWRGVLEDSRVMRSRFISLILSLNRRLTKEQCIAAHLFWTECRRLSKRSGYLFLALYLKQARVCLQRYCAKDSIPTGLSPSVSLTRGGLPRIIPSFHRRRIARGDAIIIRLYMSFFSVSKLIPLARKVGSYTFESMTQPSDLANVVKVVSEMRPFMQELITRYVPSVRSLPLYQGLEFVPTWKSVPSWPWYKALLRRTFDDAGKSLSRFASCPSIFSTLFLEQAVFASLLQFVRKDHMPQGLLWPPFVRFPFEPAMNKNISSWSLDWFEQRLWPLFPTVEQLDVRPSWGRLCAACTGDGKRRLFAIGNYMNQRLLYPFHQWLMSVLRVIPMDGTFDQTAPLRRLRGTQGEISSVDLKSATDRWPLYLLFELTKSLFGHDFASAAVNAALAMNIFDVTFVNAKRKTVSFIAGQPLGYYSSWPLFALSHHFLVWYAAETFYRGETFDRYAVLGDDVVIADPRVAAVYKSLLKRLGVSVSEGKSITSPVGACEFAKRFLLHGLTEDVSPVSMKKLADLRNPMNWYNHVTTCSPRLPLSAMLRMAGFGHKASARPFGSTRHGRRARRLLAMYMLFHMKELPAELSISVVLGRVLPPEVVGRMIYRLIEKMAPKDLVVPPPEVHPYPAMGDYIEYTLLQQWMKQYLNYLKWYAGLVQGPCNLRDFLNAPVYETSWYTRRVDLEWQRFGIAFCIVDMARQLMRYDIRCISAGRSRDPNFVLIDYQRP